MVCAGGAVLGLGVRPLPATIAIPRIPVEFAPAALAGLLATMLAAGLGAPGAIALAAGVLLAPLPVMASRARSRRDASRAASRWPDFLAAVRSRISAGASVPDATRAAASHLGGRHGDVVTGPGMPFDRAMAEARAAWADPLADRIFTTLAAAAEIGGRHVDVVLAALAASVGDELRLRAAHDAALTEQRLTAGVALVAPWAMLGLSVATNPTASQSFSSPTGSLIVVGGLIATLGGYVLAQRAARLSQPPRLFG
ncbi:MAG: hypothetical protein A2Z12_07255 [Actinobacteria bacterium RBG_16_68_21]|nr:MAG: hypothetical protein A2Z12_07255 [Actinobacteria bacterium RBG_16_68_21]